MTPRGQHPYWASLLALLATVLLLLSGRALAADPPRQATSPTIYWLELRGPLLPVLTSYLEAGIQAAESVQAEVIVIVLDSPGGQVAAVPEYLSLLLGAKVPVVLLLPDRAQVATSAPWLLTAADLTFVGPDAWIGPLVPLAPQSTTKRPGIQQLTAPAAAVALTETETQIMEVLQDLQQLTPGRPALATWLSEAVVAPRRASDLPAEAGTIHLTEVRGATVLEALHGQLIETPAQRVRLNTLGGRIVYLKPAWYLQLAQLLGDPLAIVLLLLIGIVGVASEALHPGGILPGVIGGVSLVGAGFLLTQIPITPLGLTLLILGALLMLGEAKVAGPGFLGIPGVLCFAWGVWTLVPSEYSTLQVNRMAILGAGGLVLATGMAGLSYLQRQLRSRVTTGGLVGVLGEIAEVREAVDPNGIVFVRGEYWTVRGPDDVVIPVGAHVRILSKHGPVLLVAPLSESDSPADTPAAATMPTDTPPRR